MPHLHTFRPIHICIYFIFHFVWFTLVRSHSQSNRLRVCGGNVEAVAIPYLHFYFIFIFCAKQRTRELTKSERERETENEGKKNNGLSQHNNIRNVHRTIGEEPNVIKYTPMIPTMSEIIERQKIKKIKKYWIEPLPSAHIRTQAPHRSMGCGRGNGIGGLGGRFQWVGGFKRVTNRATEKF